MNSALQVCPEPKKKNATKRSCVSRIPGAWIMNCSVSFSLTERNGILMEMVGAASIFTTPEKSSNAAVMFVIMLINQPQRQWKI